MITPQSSNSEIHLEFSNDFCADVRSSAFMGGGLLSLRFAFSSTKRCAENYKTIAHVVQARGERE